MTISLTGTHKNKEILSVAQANFRIEIDIINQNYVEKYHLLWVDYINPLRFQRTLLDISCKAWEVVAERTGSLKTTTVFFSSSVT